MTKKIKLLFGAVDIGWRIELYTTFLEKFYTKQIDIRSFVKHKVSSSQYKTNYSFHIQYAKYSTPLQWGFSFLFFLYALIRFNTFYFFSGETILTRKLRKLEFKIYRLFGKKLIMHFVGSDIRNPEYLYWKNENIKSYLKKKDNTKKTAGWQDELIKDSEQYASSILVSTPDLLELIPNSTYYPVLIDSKKFYNELQIACTTKSSVAFKSNKIRILHAPSNINVKGSNLIVEAMNSLSKERNDFEFLYTKDLKRETGSTYTVSRYELFSLYNEADIVIDQMIIGWYGLQTVEALLSNCQVICFIEEDLKDYLALDSPIINTNILSLKQVVCELIEKGKKVDFDQQRKWVVNNHTIEKNNKPFLHLFN